MTPPSSSFLFTLFLFLPSPEVEKKTLHQHPPTPPPTLLAMLFNGLFVLILVKGKFCNVWILNLISLFFIPLSVIKLMACVLSASLFTCACSSFIESSRSLNGGRSRGCLGCNVQPSFPPPLAEKRKKCMEKQRWEEVTDIW